MKSCFFIGHREANESLLPRLELEIDRLITEEQVRYFYVGGYGGFDQIAASAVKRAKEKYPDITLMLVLPYHPAERPMALPEFNACTKAYHNWFHEIIHSMDVPWTNGYIEGCNNKTKVLKRISYGMPNFNNFRKRILFCNS